MTPDILAGSASPKWDGALRLGDGRSFRRRSGGSGGGGNPTGEEAASRPVGSIFVFLRSPSAASRVEDAATMEKRSDPATPLTLSSDTTHR